MRQLDIEGDIFATTCRTVTGLLDFQVRRPGNFFFINANWTKGNETLRQAEVNLGAL